MGLPATRRNGRPLAALRPIFRDFFRARHATFSARSTKSIFMNGIIDPARRARRPAVACRARPHLPRSLRRLRRRPRHARGRLLPRLRADARAARQRLPALRAPVAGARRARAAVPRMPRAAAALHRRVRRHSSSVAPSPRRSVASSGATCPSWRRRSAGCCSTRSRRAPADFATIDLIAPVPLHRRRLRKREFNQAAELAAALRDEARRAMRRSARVALDARALERIRDTPPQTGLDSLQRRENMLDAFRVRDPDARRAESACCSSTM